MDTEKLKTLCREFLTAIGEDPDRAGLEDTPRRFASMWCEFIEYDPGKIETTFESIRADQMVVVSGMRVYSFCEHHLLPFWCDVSIGYIACDRVLGLSKFARIAHKFAHRLQLQERLVEQIAGEIATVVKSEDVAVIAQGEHGCMTTRGIRTNGLMSSSVMHGKFKHDAQTRTEFLAIAGIGK